MWKLGAAWRHLRIYIDGNKGVILLWLLFFVAGLPAAILIPQWENAGGYGWDPSISGGLLALILIAFVCTVRNGLWQGIKQLCKTHPKAGVLVIQVALLTIVALAVGANNPSRPPAPKPVQADALAPGVLKSDPQTRGEMAAIVRRFEAAEKDAGQVYSKPELNSALTGSFVGTVHNLSVDSKANFGIFVEQNQRAILGCMTVQKPLYGSGPLLGSVSDKLVRFNVTSPAFRIEFEGLVNGNRLSGTYRVVPPRGSTQRGEFILTRKDAKELPKGFDPEKNCPKDNDINH
jgi:hypothetical protein